MGLELDIVGFEGLEDFGQVGHGVSVGLGQDVVQDADEACVLLD